MTDNASDNVDPKKDDNPQDNTDGSPNDNYRDDPKLDENGNPVEDAPKKDDPPPKKDNKDDDDKDGDKTDLTNTSTDKILNYKDAKHIEGLLEQAKLVPEDVAEMVAKTELSDSDIPF